MMYQIVVVWMNTTLAKTIQLDHLRNVPGARDIQAAIKKGYNSILKIIVRVLRKDFLLETILLPLTGGCDSAN